MLYGESMRMLDRVAGELTAYFTLVFTAQGSHRIWTGVKLSNGLRLHS